jgi:hypothetical protein
VTVAGGASTLENVEVRGELLLQGGRLLVSRVTIR